MMTFCLRSNLSVFQVLPQNVKTSEAAGILSVGLTGRLDFVLCRLCRRRGCSDACSRENRSRHFPSFLGRFISFDHARRILPHP